VDYRIFYLKKRTFAPLFVDPFGEG